jgi:hypothetical protein
MPRQPGSRIKDYEIDPFSGSSPHRPVNPFSPWQLLVENTRAEKHISLRKLAELSEIPNGNIYNWTRSWRGGPMRTVYTASVNDRLSRALGLDPQELADAYNKSAFMPLDPNKPESDPRPGPRSSGNSAQLDTDGLRRFMATLHATGRDSFRILELEQIASMLFPAQPAVKPLDPGEPPKKPKK